MTFFQWFTETGEEDELAQLLRDEIYADPLVFFGQVVRSAVRGENALTRSHSPRTRTRLATRRKRRRVRTNKTALSSFDQVFSPL